MSVLRIIQDERPIDNILADDWMASVHLDGVTAIVPYEECGEMAHVTWLAVYVDDEIKYRIPARLCQIEYEP